MTVTFTVKHDGDVLDAIDPSFSRVLSGVGQCGFTLLMSDDKVAEIGNGDFVTFHVGAKQLGHGLIKKIDKTHIASGEEASQVVRYSGTCSLGDLDRAQVYPATGIREISGGPLDGLRLGRQPHDVVRRMGWPDPSFDASGWSAAVNVLSPQTAFGPIGWTDPSAWWVWSEALSSGTHPEGSCYFEDTFTCPAEEMLNVDFAFLRQGRIFLDDVLLGSIDNATDDDGAIRTRRVQVSASAGSHTLRAEVTNFSDDLAAGLLYSVWKQGTDTNRTRSSSSNTKALGYPSTPPGHTPPAIVKRYNDEWTTRCGSAQWTLNWTGNNDSDSQAMLPLDGGLTSRQGDTHLDVLAQLAETSIEFDVDPTSNGRELSIWAAEGVPISGGTAAAHGTTRTDALTTGVNLRKLSESESVIRGNAVLNRWQGGYSEFPFTESITADGRYEIFLGLDDIDQGGQAFWATARVGVSSSTAVHEVDAEVHLADGDPVPLSDWRLGDKIPTPLGTLRLVRAGYSLDGENVVVSMVFVGAQQLTIERHERWAKRTNNGTLGGRFENASPSSPAILKSQILNWDEITFSGGGTGGMAVGDRATPKAIRRKCRLHHVLVSNETAGGSNGTFSLTKNGTAVATVDVTASQTQTYTWFTSGATFDVGDVVNLVGLTDGGALSWTAEVFFNPIGSTE